MQTRRSGQKPFCKNCHVTRVKQWANDYCSSACVPRSLRQAGGRKGRLDFAYRKRAATFRSDLERLPRHCSREDLLDILMRVYKRGYHSGYNVGKLSHGNPDAWKAAQERGAA